MSSRCSSLIEHSIWKKVLAHRIPYFENIKQTTKRDTWWVWNDWEIYPLELEEIEKILSENGISYRIVKFFDIRAIDIPEYKAFIFPTDTEDSYGFGVTLYDKFTSYEDYMRDLNETLDSLQRVHEKA